MCSVLEASTSGNRRVSLGSGWGERVRLTAGYIESAVFGQSIHQS